LAVCVFALGMAVGAKAEDYTIDIRNRTSHTINSIYISPAESDDWEEDVLGKDRLRSGETQSVDITDYDSPVFDIQLVDDEKGTYTFWEVDVSKQRVIIVTVADLDEDDDNDD
jgi:hypothetical protein